MVKIQIEGRGVEVKGTLKSTIEYLKTVKIGVKSFSNNNDSETRQMALLRSAGVSQPESEGGGEDSCYALLIPPLFPLSILPSLLFPPSLQPSLLVIQTL